MKSSLLIPTILILCLLGLALLISQVFPGDQQTEYADQVTGSYTNNQNLPAGDSNIFPNSPNTGSHPTPDNRLADLVPATSDNGTSGEGRYLVIAGTFRQMINARTRARDLKNAGFDGTQLEKFDRGTYAVALVDRTSGYPEAADIADRVRQAGFEAKVYTKR